MCVWGRVDYVSVVCVLIASTRVCVRVCVCVVCFLRDVICALCCALWANGYGFIAFCLPLPSTDSDGEGSDVDGGAKLAKRGRVTAHYIVQRSSGLRDVGCRALARAYSKGGRGVGEGGIRERKGRKREQKESGLARPPAANGENMGKKKCEHGWERSRCKD